MHTPDQARELWCPMVRIARRETTHYTDSGETVVVAGCNTDALGRNRVPASCTCIAEKCSMWRWVLECDHDGHARVGFCGLAGSPCAE